ncbi:hypothetical protein KQH60_11155 [Mycetohabitans sp. B8]|uniref:hypothetical protein n=1 Tax=Mycetohabitans sp. B8 TaxID=2841845 RepID=UPI001F23CD7E|nr:hypothetical protein [Mycetohabitans sp. B8]MCG1043064.1 hypothetical protein [Mycetohabitans sp. B8]
MRSLLRRDGLGAGTIQFNGLIALTQLHSIRSETASLRVLTLTLCPPSTRRTAVAGDPSAHVCLGNLNIAFCLPLERLHTRAAASQISAAAHNNGIAARLQCNAIRYGNQQSYLYSIDEIYFLPPKTTINQHPLTPSI